MSRRFFGLIRYKWYREQEERANSLETELEEIRGQFEEQDKESVRLRGIAEENIELAEDCLREKEEAERKFAEIQRVLSTRTERSMNLSSHELDVLSSYIPPPSQSPYIEKILYPRQGHSVPNYVARFLEKVAKCPYVSRVKYVENVGSVKKSRMERDNQYEIRIIYAHHDNFGSRIIIETTAKDDRQMDFVMDLLKRELKL